MLEQAFEVAAEFRFDAGQAILNTKALQDAVDGVSQSANSALNTLSYLATGLVAHLGFGSGGLLTVMTQAVELTEDMKRLTLDMSNVIAINPKTLQGVSTFNERMAASQQIMEDISRTATQFAIPTGQLAHLTQMIATPLANRGKAGTNFSNAIEMSKNLLLSAETVGVNPGAAGESLYRSLENHMPLHGQLFSRLAATAPFQQAHIATQGQFASMNIDKKIDLVGKALNFLAMDSDSLKLHLDTLHSKIIQIKDLIMQVAQPIGDAISKPIKKILDGVKNYLQQNGGALTKAIGQLIGNIFEDPKKLLVNILQLRTFGSDFKKALHLTELFGVFLSIRKVLSLLGITLNGGLITRGLSLLFNGFKQLAAMIPWGRLLSGMFTLLRMATVELLPMFAALLFFFQVISRARAIAVINDVQNWVAYAPKIANLFARLKVGLENLMSPITRAIDTLAKFIAPLFESSFWFKLVLPLFEAFVGTIEDMGHAVIYITALFEALESAFLQIVTNIINLQNPLENVANIFKYKFGQSVENNMSRLKDMSGATQNVTNNNYINARFDMREQMEPDRIAFAVTNHLKKLAINSSQARATTVNKANSGNLPFVGKK